MEDMSAKCRSLSPPPSQQAFRFFDQLPDSMVEEILLRLPLSSVFASRCVSKLFLSLTTSPYFIQAHDEDPPLSLLLQGSLACTVRKFFVCSGAVPDIKFSGFSLSFLPRFRLITVMGSCHDLLLCCNKERFQRHYFVVNPITRQWVALPPTLHIYEFVLTGLVCDPASIPEARKGGKLRYRVVRIPESQKSLKELKVEIFSSENGQWNEFSVSVADMLTKFYWSLRAVASKRMPELFWSSRAVACNGILYWQLTWGGVQLMGLDPFNSKKKEIRTVQDPPDSLVSWSKKYKLGICQGKLRMCRAWWSEEGYSEPSHVKIWELEEGEGGVEWRLLKDESLQEIGVQLRNAAIGFGYKSMRPLAFHPSKGDIIYFACNRMKKMIRCDLKRKRVDILGNYGLKETFNGWVDAFPFQLPWWPTPIPALPPL